MLHIHVLGHKGGPGQRGTSANPSPQLLAKQAQALYVEGRRCPLLHKGKSLKKEERTGHTDKVMLFEKTALYTMTVDHSLNTSMNIASWNT